MSRLSNVIEYEFSLIKKKTFFNCALEITLHFQKFPFLAKVTFHDFTWIKSSNSEAIFTYLLVITSSYYLIIHSKAIEISRTKHLPKNRRSISRNLALLKTYSSQDKLIILYQNQKQKEKQKKNTLTSNGINCTKVAKQLVAINLISSFWSLIRPSTGTIRSTI